MKSIAIIVLSLCSIISKAQVFELTIQSASQKHSDSLYLNVPLIYGYYQENNRLISPGKNGRQTITLSCKQPLLGEIVLKNNPIPVPVLLIPGTQLQVHLNEKDSLIGMNGTAATANRLLQSLKLNAIAFFDRPDSTGKNYYTTLPLDSIESAVVIPLMKERSKKLALIEKSKLSANLKRLLQSEVIYHTLNQLNYYSRGIARLKRDDLIRFYIQTMDTLMPTRFVGNPGPEFHRYAENYVGLLEAKTFQHYQKNKLSDKDPLPYYHFSLDSGNRLVNEKGKTFMNWVAARNTMDTVTATEYAVQNLQKLYFSKDLKQFRALFQDFERYQPQSNHLTLLRKYLTGLEQSLRQGISDSSIVVWKEYENIRTIRELLASFQGKVVYLDIWGTWCGPCKEELKHLPGLKKRFEGKDVVFVYLDMDDDKLDKDWREFIHVNGMSGIHLRKNKTTILPFWDELLPGDKENHGLYPTYFIFDRQGRLVVPRAARPSDQERLYQQIESLL